MHAPSPLPVCGFGPARRRPPGCPPPPPPSPQYPTQAALHSCFGNACPLAAGPSGPCSATPVDSPDEDEFGDERGEAHEGAPAAASPVGRFRAHHSYC